VYGFRWILSEDSACVDVRKYEKEQSLLIIDSGVSRWFDAIYKVDNGLRQDNR
jgi:hypothetical protein